MYTKSIVAFLISILVEMMRSMMWSPFSTLILNISLGVLNGAVTWVLNADLSSGMSIDRLLSTAETRLTLRKVFNFSVVAHAILIRIREFRTRRTDVNFSNLISNIWSTVANCEWLEILLLWKNLLSCTDCNTQRFVFVSRPIRVVKWGNSFEVGETDNQLGISTVD